MLKLPTATALLAAALLGLTATPTLAADSDAIIEECVRDGRVSDGHALADLNAAAANLPTDVAEYTACADEIQAAITRATGGRADRESARRGGVSPAATAAAGGDPATAGGDPAAAALAEAAAAYEPEANSPSAIGDPANRGGSQPVAVPEAVLDDGPVSTAKKVGGITAAATVGGSLLALAGPALLRRRRIFDE